MIFINSKYKCLVTEMEPLQKSSFSVLCVFSVWVWLYSISVDSLSCINTVIFLTVVSFSFNGDLQLLIDIS